MVRWIISDTHFGHEKALSFEQCRGQLFRTIEEHDEFLIARWNERVDKRDTVYHLGDVAMRPATTLDRVMPRLKGKKKLILGNHDTAKIELYLKYFTKIHSTFKMGNMVLSHVPLHPAIFDKDGVKFNLHGHLHSGKIADDRYINCCVEHTGLCPVKIEELV